MVNIYPVQKHKKHPSLIRTIPIPLYSQFQETPKKILN